MSNVLLDKDKVKVGDARADILPYQRPTYLGGEVPKRFKIDLGFALDLSDILRKKMEELDGRMAADRNQGRDSSAINAAVSKEMLYVAHLAHKIETEILDAYHAFKGEDEHL